MTRATHRKNINLALRSCTFGIHHDDCWAPIHLAFRSLEKAGWTVNLTGSRYEHDADTGRPVRKVWTFEIPFGDSSKAKPFYGIITAAGCGSVEDPLASYDVVAYVS